MHRSLLAAAWWMALPLVAFGQTAILQIRVVEGEGAVHAAGSRAARPLVVEVTDETGKPIEHAAVSFHLPDDGPSGTFLNGLRTEVAITDSTGRAAVHGLQWNRIAGRFQIRIVASFEQARAGVLSAQYIDGPVAPPASVVQTAGKKRLSKWLWIGALAAGGAVAGVMAGHGGNNTVAAATASAPITTVGPPTITVGKP